MRSTASRIDHPSALGTTEFHYDKDGHLIAETGSNGLPVRQYIYLGDMPVAVVQGGQLYYIHVDHLNTPRFITNLAGATVWRWDQFEPFGVTPPNDNPIGIGSFDFPLRYPGQYYDKETNLHYNMARDYDPATGRYVQSDPIGLRGGVNTYAYVGGNPNSFVDPRGLAGMAVYFSGYQVDTGMGFSLPLGHAGVVAIDNKTGATQYFDFGRFGGEFGDVRGPYSVGTVTFDKNGMPTKESIDAIKAVMSDAFGKGNFPNTIYDGNADAKKIIDFSLDRQKNTAKFPYSVNPFGKNKLNFCDTFAADALRAGSK